MGNQHYCQMGYGLSQWQIQNKLAFIIKIKETEGTFCIFEINN
jgi:hypothetical protein